MNFAEITGELLKGKKIRRTCWDNGHYWVMDYSQKKSQLKNSIGEIPIINKKQLEAEDWCLFEEETIIKEEKRIRCCYCNNPIHVDNFAGITKKGFICGNISCLMELAREVK